MSGQGPELSFDHATGASVDADGVAVFSRIADQWWDPKGKFAPLHQFNPVRLAFIRDQALKHFDLAGPQAFTGLRLLDIGCGGGLLSEPMSRLGFDVVGVDASQRNIGAAQAHAEKMGLQIDYRCTTAESLLDSGEPLFDVILSMEVIEHVVDPKEFLIDISKLLKPGGLMVLATLNRTFKSLALAKLGAEYVLNWLPHGAHDWNKFLKPDEIRRFLAGEDLDVQGPFGMDMNPITGRWRQGEDVSMNYMMTVTRGR